MKRLITAGATDQTVYLFIMDSASTTGGGKTGLAYNTASLVCYYVRDLGSATALTLATQTVTGAHSDGGFVEVDATNMPGIYRLDLSDAVCAAGVSNVALMLKGASGMVPIPLEIQLGGGTIATVTTTTNLTNLPAAAALEATLTAMKGATFAGATDSLEAIRDRGDAAWATATGFATPTNITAGTITTVTNLTNAPTNGDLTATMKASVTAAVPSAAANASQVRTELTTELARIDVAMSTRLATAGYTAPLDAAGTRTAVGLASANLDTQLDALPTAAENAARVLDTETLDTGLTVRHGLELAAGSVLNKLSGAGTGTEIVRNFSDTADLATVTVDGSGNKTAITYDFSI